MEGIKDKVYDMQESGNKIGIVLFDEDKPDQSLLDDEHWTNQTIADINNQLPQPPGFILSNHPVAAEQADGVDPAVNMNQISVSNHADDILSGRMKTTEGFSNDVDLNLNVVEGPQQDYISSDIVRQCAKEWLTEHAGDEDFKHGVPVEGVPTSRIKLPFLYNRGVVPSRNIPISFADQAIGTSPMSLSVLPVREHDQSADIHNQELPKASVKKMKWNDKLSLEFENEGSSIFAKLEETCVQALEFIRVNKFLKDDLLYKLRSMDPFPDFIHDEVDIVEQHLRQNLNTRNEITLLRTSLKEMASETPEHRYNRIHFLDSVFSEYNKQTTQSRKPLLNTPNKDGGSPERYNFPINKIGPLTPPESETDIIFDRAPGGTRSVPQLTSKYAPREILNEQQSPKDKIIIEHDDNIALDMIPSGLLNNGSTTCYINAGLQLLASVPEIFRCVDEGVKFLEESENRDLTVSKAFIAFMEERDWAMGMQLQVGNLEGSFAPDMVTDVMFQRYPKQFKRNTQQDCMEFVTALLEAIHEEIGEERSPVGKLFMGVQRRFLIKDLLPTESEELKATDSTESLCNEREEFSSLPLHFTPQHSNIEDCFSFYTTKQYSSEGKSLHWCLFEKLPRLLLVHVLSFDESEQGPKKALMKVVLRDILQFQKEWMYQAPAAEAAVAETAVAEYAVAEAEVAEYAVAEHAGAEAEVAEYAVAEYAVAEAEVAEAEVAEAAVAEAAVVEAEVSEYAVSEYAVAEYAVAEAEVAEAAVAEAAFAEAAFAEAAVAEAAVAEAAVAEAAVAEESMLVEHAVGSLVDGLSFSSGPLSLTDEVPSIELDNYDPESLGNGVSECDAQFHLRAVVLHSGLKTTYGHYTAAVSVPGRSGTRVWYHCNDQIVQRMTSLQDLRDFCHDAEVTCLLYEREECSTL